MKSHTSVLYTWQLEQEQMSHLAGFEVVDVLLGRRIALDQQLGAVQRQVVEVRQRTHNPLRLLKFAEPEALRLVRLRILCRSMSHDESCHTRFS